MQLYYSPFTCSLAAHITWREAGLHVTMRHVDFATKVAEPGLDLATISSMAQVPILVTEDGETLTENLAVLSYLADRAPDRRLTPASTSPARYEFLRWLGFVATEVHKKVLNNVFSSDAPDAVRDYARGCAAQRLRVLASHLETRETLVGDDFTVADAYLVWALMIMPHAGIPLEPYPALRRYLAHHSARPAVAEAVAFERDRRRRDA